MELRNQPPSSQPLTAPVHPPERVTGPPELHHSEGRYPVEDREVSALACLEVPLSIAAYAIIAIHFQTFAHIAAAAVVAPLFLLRTDASMDWAHRHYRRLARTLNLDHKPEFNFLDVTYILTLNSLALVLAAMLIRTGATLLWFVRSPLRSLREIPRNWYQQTLCIDITHPPELIPGENLRHYRDPENSYSALRYLIDGIRNEES
jgi:hypothetical protein